MKKALMIVLDVVLWICVSIPVIRFLIKCAGAAVNGAWVGIGDPEQVFGVSAFFATFFETLIFGLFWVFLWGIVLAAAIGVTILSIHLMKKWKTN